MEWERFFSQSQSSAAPVSAPNSYDSNRNVNPNVSNVGVIGGGRHSAPSGTAHPGNVGSGRMGPNYSLGTQFAQGQGQGLGQGQGQGQGQAAANITNPPLRDVFTNPLPTTYGGVERANQLLRSLHEQSQDTSDNTYYPSSLPQQQLIQQRPAYDPVIPSSAAPNRALNVPLQNVGSSGDYSRGIVNGNGSGGYDQRGQPQGGPIGTPQISRSSDIVGAYQKSSAYVGQGLGLGGQGQGLGHSDQMGQQNAYRAGGSVQDNTNTQPQGQLYQGQGSQGHGGAVHGNQGQGGQVYGQHVNNQASLQTGYNGLDSPSVQGQGRQDIRGGGADGVGVGGGGADSRYNSSTQQQVVPGQRGNAGVQGGFGGSNGGPLGQGTGQGHGVSQGQGQGLGQGLGNNQWQQMPANRSAVAPQGVQQSSNDYPVAASGDVGGRYNRDYPQPSYQAAPVAAQPYVNASQPQQRYSQQPPAGLVVGDVRYKAPVDQRDLLRDQRDVYTGSQQHQGLGQGQGQVQGQGQGQGVYVPAKASTAPQYQHQQGLQPQQQLQQQQSHSQSQSQYLQQTHQGQPGQQGNIPLNIPHSTPQNIPQNIPQQYQAQRTQDVSYDAPNQAPSIIQNQNLKQNRPINQNQNQNMNQNQNLYQATYTAPQQVTQVPQRSTTSRFNQPQGAPSLQTQHVTEAVAVSGPGKYGQSGT